MRLSLQFSLKYLTAQQSYCATLAILLLFRNVSSYYSCIQEFTALGAFQTCFDCLFFFSCRQHFAPL